MKPLSELRKELAKKETEYNADLLYFNAIHKRAKALKKKMVQDRKEIEDLEKQIAVKR